MKLPTIKDIAEKTNLSKSTVVRVINNNGYVSLKSRKKIEQVINKLNYTPNKLAQGLKNRNSMMIGHLLPISSDNPFFSLIARSIEENAQLYQYGIITKFIYSSSAIDKIVKDLIGHMVSGIIITSMQFEYDCKILEKYKNPIVFVEREGFVNGAAIKKVDTVLINSFKGSYDATKMLIENGHKKIAFVGRALLSDLEKERYNGYTAAMNEAFGDAYPRSIHLVEKYSIEHGYTVAKEIFEREEMPTAIYASSDRLAVGVMQLLYEKKLRIPDDISLIGFSNSYSSFVSPKLSTVANRFDEIGKNAVEMIIERINNNSIPYKKLIIDPYLIDRGSVKNIN